MSHMLGYTVFIQDVTTGELIPFTDRAIPGSFRINRFGIQWDTYMGPYEAARYIDDIRVYKIIATRLGDDRQYRLTVPRIKSDRVGFTGTPLVSVIDDVEFNFFFSTRNMDLWHAATEDQSTGVSPGKYITSEIALGSRGYATLIGGQAYGNGVDGYGWYFETNRLHTAGVTYVAFEFEQNLPAGWTVQILRLSRGTPWGYVGTAWSATPTGPSSYKSGLAVPITAADVVLIWIVNNSGVTYTAPAGSTGTYFFYIKNIRTMGYNNSNVSTTLSANIASGSNVLINVGTTVGMFVGDDVYFDSAAAASALTNSEKTQILSVDGPTQFRANIGYSHLAGVTVRTQRITERGVTDRLLNTSLNVNAGWLQISQAFIGNTGRDLDESSWFKAKPSSVMADLARLDSYAWGVNRAGYLYFYPEGTYSRTWIVDAISMDINRPIEGQNGQFRNSVRAEYKNFDGTQLVTATATNPSSIAGSGLTRSITIEVDTTNQTSAETIRDLYLADNAPRPVEASIRADYIMNEIGVITAADSPEEGDYIKIRNVSAIWDDPDLTAILIVEVELDPETGQPTIIPSAPIQTLDRWLARNR